MSLLIFLKVFGDVCICSAVVSAFPVLLECNYSLVWPALLCGAGAAVATLLSEHGNQKLRYLGLLLPCLSLLLAHTLVEYLILVPGMVYATVVVIRGEFMLEYYNFRDSFKKMMIVLAGFAVLIFLARYTEEMTRSWMITMDYVKPVQYTVYYGISGVFLLRQLRMGGDSGSGENAMNRKQLWIVLAGIAVCLLVVVGMERLLQAYATSIFETLAEVVKMVLSLPLLLIGWIVSLFLDQRGMDEFMEERPAVTMPDMSKLVPVPYADPETVVKEQRVYSPMWAVIIVLVIMVAVMLFAVRLFRVHRSQVRGNEFTEAIAVEKAMKKESAKTNRGKIRRYYREFLKDEKRNGQKLNTSQTSEDILNGASKHINRTAAAKLRDVYLPARYAEHHEITVQQVKIARESLKGTIKT